MRLAIAVIVGYALWTVIWLGSNAGVAAAFAESFDAGGVTQRPGILGLLLAISMIASVAAGFTAIAIHRAASLKAAVIMGVLLLATGIGVQAGYWNVMPLWYHLIFLAALVPMTLIGARMRVASSSQGQVA